MILFEKKLSSQKLEKMKALKVVIALKMLIVSMMTLKWLRSRHDETGAQAFIRTWKNAMKQKPWIE